MGHPWAPSRARRLPAACSMWRCVLVLSMLATISQAAAEDSVGSWSDTDGGVPPLPLLLRQSPRSDEDEFLSRRASDLFGDSLWTSRATRGEHDYAAREELVVSAVIKDNNFHYGAGVHKWHSLAVGSTTYLVGLGLSNITILAAEFVGLDVESGQTYSLTHQNIDLGIAPSAAALLKNWNPHYKELEAVLVLYDAAKGKLNWYKISNSGLESIGSWTVNKKITSLKAFQAKDRMKLMMLTSCDTTLELVSCNASADVLDFSLNPSFDAKLIQTITLEAEAVSADIAGFGDNIHLVLALPDGNRAKVFHYHWPLLEAGENVNDTIYGHFRFLEDIDSPRVTHAVFFHVDFKMYVAIGGEKPALFRFVSPTRIEGCGKALQNIGFVSTWLVLPVESYRHEVVLLAQVERVINSMPFRGIMTLTWASAGIFKWQSQPRCYIGGQEVPGESCFVGDNGEFGLDGAIAVQLGDSSVVNVIVPMGLQVSAQFRVYSSLQPVTNPLHAEVEMLRNAEKKLYDEIERQDHEMLRIEEILKDTLLSDGPNIIKGEWSIVEVESMDPETNLSPQSPSEDVSVKELMTALETLQKSTQSLQSKLMDAAVPQNGEIHLSGSQSLLGGLVVDNLSLHHLSASRLNGEPISTLLTDAVRKESLKKITGTKTILNLKTQNVNFSTINDIPRDDIVFNVPYQPVRVYGNLEVTQLLHVHGNVDLPPSGTVGDIDLSEQILLPGREFNGMVRFDEVTVEGDLSVNIINKITMNPPKLKSIASGSLNGGEGVIYDTLRVNGQLQAEKINGLLWNDLVKRIVWRDTPNFIPDETIVTGALDSESIIMDQFNSMDFPNEFVLRSSVSQQITGKKIIQDQLLTKVLDISETVDGVPVTDLVTLTTDQTLHGELKLKEADIVGDVMKVLSVNGIGLGQFHHTSPLIGEGDVISSNVELSHIVVEGPIQISNTLNSRNFKENILNIVVLPTLDQNETVKIGGKKTILGNVKVDGIGIKVESDIVNERKLSRIANTETVMTFKGKKLIENVVFKDISLTGLWDQVNIDELNAGAIRLDGNQETSTHLKFIDPLPSQPSKLFASRLVITDEINSHNVNSISDPQNNEVCGKGSEFDCDIQGSIEANIVRVGGNISVDGKVCGWSLDDFEKRRMSRSRPQQISGKLKLETINITSHVTIDLINSKPIPSFKQQYLSFSPFDLEKLKMGGFVVKEMVIEGNIFTSRVNSMKISDVANRAVKLKGGNKFEGDITFTDTLNVASLAVDGPVNGLNLAYMIKDAVYKNEATTISGRKIFMAGFDVDGTIHTRNLNNLDPLNVITKDSPAIVSGPLRVLGNVYAGNVNLTGLLNKIPIENYQNRYRLESEGRHILMGNSHFLTGTSVEELYVMKSVQGENLKDFFNSVVLKNQWSQITGHKLFLNKAVFKNVKVEGLVNNLNLKELAEDVVLHNDEDSVANIKGRITFVQNLVAPSGVSLSENLQASTVDGCLIQEWLDNAVYLDQPMTVSGLKKFTSMSSSSDLKLSRINAVDLSKVITLHTPQNIPVNVMIEAAVIQHNLNVDGLVNGKNLQEEYDNTLMTTGNQVVSGSKTFLNGVTVEKNVKLQGLISNKNITNVVILQNQERLTGPLKFSDLVLDGDLSVSGHISGIDVKKWEERAFLKSSLKPQTVVGSWSVEGKVKLLEPVGGSGLLDGESVLELRNAVYTSREKTRKTQESVKADWMQLCHDTDTLQEKARAQPFLFQELEVVQSIRSNQIIASMHAFEALNNQFLAVSFSNNCSGALYQWNGQETAWKLLDSSVQNIGNVQRWATMRNSGSTYLITSSLDSQNCPYSGGNVWRFEGSSNLNNIRTVDSWHDVQVDEPTGQIHLLGRTGVQTWQLEDGAISNKSLQAFPEAGRSQFVPGSASSGLSTSDGEVTRQWDDSSNNSMSRSANPNLPARNEGNVVSMKTGDGQKLIAVTAYASDMLVVYKDVASSQPLARVNVRGARSLSVLELAAPGRTGQTLLAFIEDERHLRVVQYKGVEGFVDVTKSKLPFPIKEMVPVRLFARGLVNQRHFLLLRSDYQVLLIEVEMSGDPLDDQPLQCVLP